MLKRIFEWLGEESGATNLEILQLVMVAVLFAVLFMSETL